MLFSVPIKLTLAQLKFEAQELTDRVRPFIESFELLVEEWRCKIESKLDDVLHQFAVGAVKVVESPCMEELQFQQVHLCLLRPLVRKVKLNQVLLR